ncbi:MAG: hypothetical protein JO340_10135 [Acidobacteriaceae bacterium]|nr:hypothetical protein [Acidobacteriaceae bacterium]
MYDEFIAEATSPAIIDSVQKIDLYIKVQLDLDPEEKPERVAAEILRQLEKFYAVRSTEVSNIVVRE